MKIYCYILFGIALLLSSCMGESGDVWKYGSQAGVIRGASEKYIQLYSGDRITSGILQEQTYKIGDCFLVDYKVNYGKPDSIEPGYYKVEIQKMEPVPHWNIGNIVDTISISRYESFLTLDWMKSLYVDGYLFIYPEYKRYYASQRDSFLLFYNPDMKPETDELTGKECLHVYLRSTCKYDASDTVYQSNISLPQALDISELVMQAIRKGYVSGDSLNVRVSYPEYFLADSASVGWRTSEALTILLNNKKKNSYNH